MLFKSIALVTLLSSSALGHESHSNLRATGEAELENASEFAEVIEHLDLELVHPQTGERELFPLLPGTKCPTGHSCKTRTVNTSGLSPLVSALKANMRTPLALNMEWKEFDANLNQVVKSDDRCARRDAMARAAGLAAGVLLTTVNKPAYAAETKIVKMGADNGQLIFDPAKISICKGDSVKWINNKGGPHNVVFDEDAIPSGVDQESISMSEQLGEEGDSWSMSFDKPGDYDYYCEPHRGAGMQAKLVVTG
ncbi:hypothetical protein TrVE_jg10597 [Triparma verrucosa]|uniref:Blue (type 1) copper domain-containing protein n=2 Tax=Triparma TaxID=722752 RepID=A0A9W6ZUN6_9STRA|nr:hypothetical protein TrST_g14078 [Triparma strigata]GMI02554.1 hypothetical protein TrVE_jg10597 [Triparma verrucosa]